MGYTTDFSGSVSVDPPLNPSEVAYLEKFCDTRRMLMKQGPYYVGNPGHAGQDHGPNVINYNQEAEGQPSLWCHWIASDDGTEIYWDGGEKFYSGDVWMKYIIDHFLKPGAEASQGVDVCEHCGRGDGDPQFADFTFDHYVNGEITAQGEEADDHWKLVVTDNAVSVKKAKVVWE